VVRQRDRIGRNRDDAVGATGSSGHTDGVTLSQPRPLGATSFNEPARS
jgi:hypothetical protein